LPCVSDFIFQVINNDWNVTKFGVKIKAEVGVTATNRQLLQLPLTVEILV